ncbi:MAG: hypothetical protein SRB2_03645 [Desulfobacteraceae bacterium Eth-SRB2]|nr:MAG: hypothetical protein SRB2_03645 [Desulfobacteraceae bacterium Eth-SRB2]
MEQFEFGKNQTRDWLNDAMPLDVFQSSSLRLRRLVNRLFDTIIPLIKVSSKSRQKEALKIVLINLYQANQLDKPVRYSRDKNSYTRDRRYGQLFFKYDRIIPIIDGLERLGYIEQSTFYFDHENEEGKQTRMWGTETLWSLFREHRIPQSALFIPEQAQRNEIIILRNESKKDIGYRETRQIRRMREDLERYNAFVSKHIISLQLKDSTIVDNRFLVEDIYKNIHKGSVWIKSVRFCSKNIWEKIKNIPIPSFTKHNIKFSCNPRYIINNLQDNKTNPSTITHTKWSVDLLSVLLQRFWSDEHRFEKFLVKRSYEISRIPWKERLNVLAQEFPLRDIGVKELEIILDQEQLHRIFNMASWKLGGRAYGALHQDMVRRHMRKHIRIDSQPTVEIDYSAFHILMLYHLEGIDYQDDPYSVCEGLEKRDIYKAVGLIAINAENDRKAYGAIRQELKDRGIPLPLSKKPLVRLVRTFRETHKAIEPYLFSGIGRTLQNIDGNIMNAILVRLMDRGILGLSVYDSVIVAEQYADILREIMVAEYEKVMKFKPMF